MAERIFIVSYDIRDPKRLNKVHKTMCDFGEPRQYSVFECWLTDKNLVRLKHQLNEIINHDDDQVLIIPLCDACMNAVQVIGYPKPKEIPKTIIL